MKLWDFIPDDYFVSDKRELLKCQTCGSDRILVTHSDSTLNCDTLECKQCAQKVSGYGDQRLGQLWNAAQLPIVAHKLGVVSGR